MTCKQWLLFQQGELNAQAFARHAATCRACQAVQRWNEAAQQALTAPAAPAELIDRVLAKTTRRPSVWQRWRAVLVGGLAVVLVAVGVGVRMWHPATFTHSELVAYMSENTSDEYATFLSDLNLLEQTF